MSLQDIVKPVRYNPSGKLIKKVEKEMYHLRQSTHFRLFLCNSLARILPQFTLVWLRTRIYRIAGCDFGWGVAIQGAMHLSGDGPITSRLHVGQCSLIAPDVTIGLNSDVTIESNVSIGPHAKLYTATHGLGFGSRRMNYMTLARPIIIEDGAWVGMCSLILPGVTLGRGCVVAAGAVVSEDVPPNTLVAGNPAVVVQHLPFGDR